MTYTQAKSYQDAPLYMLEKELIHMDSVVTYESLPVLDPLAVLITREELLKNNG